MGVWFLAVLIVLSLTLLPILLCLLFALLVGLSPI